MLLSIWPKGKAIGFAKVNIVIETTNIFTEKNRFGKLFGPSKNITD